MSWLNLCLLLIIKCQVKCKVILPLQYCSDGVWDPEKWHASLYPNSGKTSPVESLKKELDADRPALIRRIAGEYYTHYELQTEWQI